MEDSALPTPGTIYQFKFPKIHFGTNWYGNTNFEQTGDTVALDSKDLNGHLVEYVGQYMIYVPQFQIYMGGMFPCQFVVPIS